eukprot:m.676860 g.676860  ORF g.676860 m.676860 type:complete len:485 (+) comp22792_c0_seq5:1213-2667(+)
MSSEPCAWCCPCSERQVWLQTRLQSADTQRNSATSRGNPVGHFANDTFTFPALKSGNDPLVRLQHLLQRFAMILHALQRLLRHCWSTAAVSSGNSATNGGPVTVVPIAALLGVACRALETDGDALRLQTGRHTTHSNQNGNEASDTASNHQSTPSLFWHRFLRPALPTIFASAMSLANAVVDVSHCHIVRHQSTVIRIVETVLARPSSSAGLRIQAYDILNLMVATAGPVLLPASLEDLVAHALSDGNCLRNAATQAPSAAGSTLGVSSATIQGPGRSTPTEHGSVLTLRALQTLTSLVVACGAEMPTVVRARIDDHTLQHMLALGTRSVPPRPMDIDDKVREQLYALFCTCVACVHPDGQSTCFPHAVHVLNAGLQDAATSVRLRCHRELINFDGMLRPFAPSIARQGPKVCALVQDAYRILLLLQANRFAVDRWTTARTFCNVCRRTLYPMNRCTCSLFRTKLCVPIWGSMHSSQWILFALA